MPGHWSICQVVQRNGRFKTALNDGRLMRQEKLSFGGCGCCILDLGLRPWFKMVLFEG